MRLWHYKLLPYIPNSQLIAQWRELNAIFKKQDNHILINYVYEYPKENLKFYSLLVMTEITMRGIQIKSVSGFINYFENNTVMCDDLIAVKPYPTNPFPNHHTNRYLLQCFYNLQEKYDRGQKDFDKNRYEKLKEFVENEIH